LSKGYSKLILNLIAILIISCTWDSKRLYEKGEKYYRAGRYVEAILAYTEIITGEDENLRREAYYKIALIHYVNLKNNEKAIEMLELYLKKFPDGKRADEALKLLGDIYYQNYQNYNRAIVEYQKLIENYPGSKYKTEAMFKMGKNYFLLDNFPQAIVEYKKILRKFPDSEMNPSVELEIALCYNLIGKKKEAIDRYISIIRKYVKKPDIVIMAKYYLASIYEETEQLTKALKLYKTIKFTYPNPAIIELKIDRIKYRRSIQGRD